MRIFIFRQFFSRSSRGGKADRVDEPGRMGYDTTRTQKETAGMEQNVTMNPSGFVLLADFVPQIVQEIRYHSTYNFIGDRIDGYEEPCALLTIEAARALKDVSSEVFVQGFLLKVFDAYRPAGAVRQFVLWGIEDQDIRMKPYFYPEL